jgi:integrase
MLLLVVFIIDTSHSSIIRWHRLGKGVHPTYVQKLLGHQSIRLSLDLYSHWMPPIGEQTAIAMQDALKG